MIRIKFIMTLIELSQHTCHETFIKNVQNGTIKKGIYPINEELFDIIRSVEPDERRQQSIIYEIQLQRDEIKKQLKNISKILVIIEDTCDFDYATGEEPFIDFPPEPEIFLEITDDVKSYLKT